MAVSLNFSRNEKESIKKAFAVFPKGKTRTDFEEERWIVKDCTITLYNTGKLVIQGKKEKTVKRLLIGLLGLEEDLLIGIDEAGRGESTGPMTVGVVLGDKNKLRELRDSKKIGNLNEKEKIVTKNALAHATFSFSSRYIDMVRRKGISLNELQRRVIEFAPRVFNACNENIGVKVDGKRLKNAPREVEFLVKGDDLEPVIGAASVLAKTARHRSADTGKRKTWNSKKAQKQ